MDKPNCSWWSICLNRKPELCSVCADNRRDEVGKVIDATKVEPGDVAILLRKEGQVPGFHIVLCRVGGHQPFVTWVETPQYEADGHGGFLSGNYYKDFEPAVVNFQIRR